MRSSQLHLFVFLGIATVETFLGGPTGDRIGPKFVIWCSILGVLPSTLNMPMSIFPILGILSAVIGVVSASAFSAIIVYAQELMPGPVGLVSGIFFGLAIRNGQHRRGSAGPPADITSIIFVYKLCAWLLAIGLFTGLLPDLDR